MKKLYSLLILCCALLISSKAKAQDPAFSQFYSNPIYLNPAFAGAHSGSRFGLNYRNQWPGIGNGFVTYSGSFDRSMKKENAGYGLHIINDKAGDALSYTSVSALYSYRIKVTQRFFIRSGFQVSYFQRTLNTNKLTFGDQLNPWYGEVSTTNEKWGEVPIANKMDLSTGVLAYSKQFYAGLAVHHLAEPQSNSSSNARIERKYTLHAGICPKETHEEKLHISPHFLYQKQGKFQQLNAGVYLMKKCMTAGLWVRGKDAFIFLVGLEMNNYRLGYSYDFTYSNLQIKNTRGAHELSFIYTIQNKTAGRKMREVRCPVF